MTPTERVGKKLVLDTDNSVLREDKIGKRLLDAHFFMKVGVFELT